MAANTTLSAAYLAESKTQLVTTMYAVPIALETLSTGWRLWAAATAQSGFAYADYLMLFATVCCVSLETKKRGRVGSKEQGNADGLKLVAIAECVTGLVYGMPVSIGINILLNKS
jgi:hypothetical protein